MAVIIQYIVERNGVQKMTFADKKAADAYDKMLDIADTFYGVLEKAPVELSDQQLEDLSLYLAKHTDALTDALKGAKLKPKKKVSSDADINAKQSKDVEAEPNVTDIASSQNVA